jgi:hypothetical protein
MMHEQLACQDAVKSNISNIYIYIYKSQHLKTTNMGK